MTAASPSRSPPPPAESAHEPTTTFAANVSHGRRHRSVGHDFRRNGSGRLCCAVDGAGSRGLAEMALRTRGDLRVDGHDEGLGCVLAGAAVRVRGARVEVHGGAGFWPARRGVEGDARRWPRHARLPLRKAGGAGTVGLGSELWYGRQHAAGLAQVRRRKAAAEQALRIDRRQRRVVSVRPDGDAAPRLVQEGHPEAGRLQGSQVPHRRHRDRPLSGHGRRGQPAARRGDRVGHRPRCAGRRRVQ